MTGDLVTILIYSPDPADPTVDQQHVTLDFVRTPVFEAIQAAAKFAVRTGIEISSFSAIVLKNHPIDGNNYFDYNGTYVEWKDIKRTKIFDGERYNPLCIFKRDFGFVEEEQK